MPECAAKPGCSRFVDEPSARFSRMPAAMLPAIPSAWRVVAASRPADASRPTAVAPNTPQMAVGWKPHAWKSGPATMPRRVTTSLPATIAASSSAPVAPVGLGGGERRGHDRDADVRDRRPSACRRSPARGRSPVVERGVGGWAARAARRSRSRGRWCPARASRRARRSATPSAVARRGRSPRVSRTWSFAARATSAGSASALREEVKPARRSASGAHLRRSSRCRSRGRGRTTSGASRL